MSIPMVNLNRLHQRLKVEIEPQLLQIAASNHYVLGPTLAGFEQAVSDYLGSPFAYGVGSGTDALLLTLKALDIGPGDEVITTVFTFVGTAEAIVHSGATPVFVDIEPDTFNLDVEQVAAAVTSRTKAVLAVHLYGQAAEMDPLVDLCQLHGLPLLEDCAQAFGAEYQGTKLGTLGTAGCFSFYPSKNLGAFGDGGMVVTDDPALAKRLRQLRNHGSEQHYVHLRPGYSSRLDELQAAVLNIKLRHVEQLNLSRANLAKRYIQRLVGSGITLPYQAPERRHVFQQFTIRTTQRERLQQALSQRGIASAVHYACGLHQQPVFAELCRDMQFPQAELAAREVLSLPMCPELRFDEVDQICDTISVALESTPQHEDTPPYVRSA